ncbi:MAG: RsmB/NOP family class I SAM-dependent RNA methyltransferase [Saprospiraceae bacterium]|nr:RsmB/NOP family class I SAM-dependent RNA methyltransferase [Saprospiraceae bacterium]
MKIHKNLLLAVYNVIVAVINEAAYADKTIERTLKSNPKWGSKDRAFIAETSYDIIRYYRLLEYVAESSEDIWKIIAAYLCHRKTAIPEFDEFKTFSSLQFEARLKEACSDVGLRESFSNEWVSWFQSNYPDSYADELHALNQPAPLVLRVNTLRISKEKLFKMLVEAGRELTIDEGYPDALIASKKWNVFQDDLFKAGYFEIQDASSQRVAAFMELKPGMRVIDACSGAGGKCLHMAALMQNKGQIIAMDTGEWKLEELRKRARRAGVHCIEPRHIHSSKVIKRLHESCDRLLLDVPCSGTGVVRRNPDTKWKVNTAYVSRMAEVQKDLLHRYSLMLKPGGKMVYATCSILDLENSDQISYFCSEHPGFQLEEEIKISPFCSGFDGFYMARLKRI